jgi:heme/copper-type cytochrome/quinol oxidase subunit 2
MTAFEQTVLNVAGVQNGHIHTMWTVLIYICTAMYLLVVCFLAWALWRARKTGHAHRTPDAPGMSTALHAWIGLVVVALFGITVTSYAVDRAPHAHSATLYGAPMLEARDTRPAPASPARRTETSSLSRA